MKQTANVSTKEKQTLYKIIKESEKHRTRQRAHAVILSSKNYNIKLISNVFDVHPHTICRWIKGWNDRKFRGLEDAAKPGRPPKRDFAKGRKSS